LVTKRTLINALSKFHIELREFDKVLDIVETTASEQLRVLGGENVRTSTGTGTFERRRSVLEHYPSSEMDTWVHERSSGGEEEVHRKKRRRMDKNPFVDAERDEVVVQESPQVTMPTVDGRVTMVC
jgi:hypothetical protein